MKNIQVIDDAINCTYDIFEIDDEGFGKIFPNGQDIEFEDDFVERLGAPEAALITKQMWANRLDKKFINGIHGTLFYGEHCNDKKPFYPTKKDAEMIANP